MSYTDEEMVKVLKVQALTLKNLENSLNSMSSEIRRHRSFIRQMLLAIKQTTISVEKEEPEALDELPNNVLSFPPDQGEQNER